MVPTASSRTGELVQSRRALWRELRSVLVVGLRQHQLNVAATLDCYVGDELIRAVGHPREQLHAGRRATLNQVIDDGSDDGTSVVVAAGIQISVACDGDPQQRQWVFIRSHRRSLAPVPACLEDEDRARWRRPGCRQRASIAQPSRPTASSVVTTALAMNPKLTRAAS